MTGNHILDLWLGSGIGFLSGYGAGFLMWGRKLMSMSTPQERTKRFKFNRDVIVGVVLFILGIGTIWNAQMIRSQAEHQRTCLSNYTESNSKSSVARSAAVIAESKANRKVITDFLEGKITTQEKFKALGVYYTAEMAKVDLQRKKNPLKKFDPERCRG